MLYWAGRKEESVLEAMVMSAPRRGHLATPDMSTVKGKVVPMAENCGDKGYICFGIVHGSRVFLPF